MNIATLALAATLSLSSPHYEQTDFYKFDLLDNKAILPKKTVIEYSPIEERIRDDYRAKATDIQFKMPYLRK